MFQLLVSVVDARSPLSTVGIPVMLYGLLGTPGNLELRKTVVVVGLTVKNVSLAGLIRDIDEGVMCGTASHDALCTDQVQRSLQRDQEQISEETLWYCYALGLLELEERNSL